VNQEQERVLNVIKDLTQEYGRCAFGVDLISELTKIPHAELWDRDNFGGILGQLSDDGYIVFMDRSANPDVALDEDVLV